MSRKSRIDVPGALHQIVAGGEVLASGRYKKAVKARSIVCFWAMRELGISQSDSAERFGISQPAVTIAVRRGERLAKNLTSQ